MLFGVQAIDPRHEPEFTYGVRAALAAFAAGTLVAIELIPLPPSQTAAKMTNVLVRVFIAIGVVLAGWFWLLDETKGSPAPYFATLLPLVSIGAVAILGIALMGFLALTTSRDK